LEKPAIVIETVLAARCPATVCLQTVKGAILVMNEPDGQHLKSQKYKITRPYSQFAKQIIAVLSNEV
jgi:hypothetical protein